VLAEEVANLTVKLVSKLPKPSRKRGMLPEGLGLNVNFPLFEVDQGSELPWALTRFGNGHAFIDLQ
jgi:hypothetical protein